MDLFIFRTSIVRSYGVPKFRANNIALDKRVYLDKIFLISPWKHNYVVVLIYIRSTLTKHF